MGFVTKVINKFRRSKSSLHLRADSDPAPLSDQLSPVPNHRPSTPLPNGTRKDSISDQKLSPPNGQVPVNGGFLSPEHLTVNSRMSAKSSVSQVFSKLQKFVDKHAPEAVPKDGVNGTSSGRNTPIPGSPNPTADGRSPAVSWRSSGPGTPDVTIAQPRIVTNHGLMQSPSAAPNNFQLLVASQATQSQTTATDLDSNKSAAAEAIAAQFGGPMVQSADSKQSTIQRVAYESPTTTWTGFASPTQTTGSLHNNADTANLAAEILRRKSARGSSRSGGHRSSAAPNLATVEHPPMGSVGSDSIPESSIHTVDDTEQGVRINNYHITKTIGRGAYGIVSLAVDESTGQQYAVKVISKRKMSSLAHSKSFASRVRIQRRPKKKGDRDPSGREASRISEESGASNSLGYMNQIKKEIAILKKLQHPNCLGLTEVIEDSKFDQLYLVTELCEKGVVLKIDSQEPVDPLPLEKCIHYFRQMILGLEYLHEHDIVHRDIKPDNLLVTANDVLKFSDFGVSEMFGTREYDTSMGSAGAPAFKAPEMVQDTSTVLSLSALVNDQREEMGQRADIWAIGVCLYCFRYGKLPFTGVTFVDLYTAIRDEQPSIPEDEDENLKDLFARILAKNPIDRISIPELREHPWVTENGTRPLITRTENLRGAVMELSEAEVDGAIKKLSGLITVLKLLKDRPWERSIKAGRKASSRLNEVVSENDEFDPAAITDDKADPTKQWFQSPASSIDSDAPSQTSSRSPEASSPLPINESPRSQPQSPYAPSTRSRLGIGSPPQNNLTVSSTNSYLETSSQSDSAANSVHAGSRRGSLPPNQPVMIPQPTTAEEVAQMLKGVELDKIKAAVEMMVEAVEPIAKTTAA